MTNRWHDNQDPLQIVAGETREKNLNIKIMNITDPILSHDLRHIYIFTRGWRVLWSQVGVLWVVIYVAFNEPSGQVGRRSDTRHALHQTPA